MNAKNEIRSELSKSVEDFLASGGTITTLPSKKIRTKNTAACRYRRGVGSKAERFKAEELHPLHSWCRWSPETLTNINYRPSFFLRKP